MKAKPVKTILDLLRGPVNSLASAMAKMQEEVYMETLSGKTPCTENELIDILGNTRKPATARLACEKLMARPITIDGMLAIIQSRIPKSLKVKAMEKVLAQAKSVEEIEALAAHIGSPVSRKAAEKLFRQDRF